MNSAQINIEKYIPLTQKVCETMQNAIKYEKD